jgi:surface protein
MATKVDYANGIDIADIGTVYLTGAGYVNYPFHGISRDSALGWEEPVWGAELNRSVDLVMDNIDDVDYGLVARCEISYKYMNVQDYIALCKIAKQRVCTANFVNRETGERVTQEMAFTGNEVGKLIKFGKDYLGSADVSIKLVATNRDRQNIIDATHTITYNANGGSGSVAQQSSKWAGQLKLADSGFTKTAAGLSGWNTSADGSGNDYVLGQSVTIFNDMTLYACWEKNVLLKQGSSLNLTFRSVSNSATNKIIFDNFTGNNEYVVDGVNKIAGLTSIGYADDENISKIFRSTDNKTIYILVPIGWNIYANPNCENMFYFCTGLTTVEFNNFNTSLVTTMYQLFRSCFELQSVDLSGFDMSKVSTVWSMFTDCEKLTNVTFSSNMKSDAITNMGQMFAGCTILTSIDLSGFDTGNVRDMSNMFNGCYELTTIYVSSALWETNLVNSSNNMFGSCVNLVGGNGTTFDGVTIDKTYARIDAPGTPGYLTEAS